MIYNKKKQSPKILTKNIFPNIVKTIILPKGYVNSFFFFELIKKKTILQNKMNLK